MIDIDTPVIWDAYGTDNRFSGVGRYAYELFQSLSDIGVKPILLSHELSASNLPGASLLRSSDQIPAPLKLIHRSKLFHSYQNLPNGLQSIDPNRQFEKLIFHGLSNFNLPLISPKRGLARRFSFVLTVHDLIPMIVPRKVSSSLRLQMKHLLTAAVRRADRIICVSEWTRNTLIERYPEIESRTIHISNGIHRPAGLDAKRTYVPRGTGAELLMVSRYEVYKRFDILVSVLRRLKKDISAVVVTDQRGVDWLRKHAEDLLRSKRLRFYSSISDQELLELYHRCALLLQPSELEGFCLPAAEAISYGVPVLFQAGSGIDEVVVDCGLGLSSKASIDDWVGAVEKIVNDGLSFNQQRWAEQQKTWPDVAQAIRSVYNDLG